jgi:hypothetical protein
MPVNFGVNAEGPVVLHRADGAVPRKVDRVEAARGKADVKWNTEDLMAMLRGED